MRFGVQPRHLSPIAQKIRATAALHRIDARRSVRLLRAQEARREKRYHRSMRAAKAAGRAHEIILEVAFKHNMTLERLLAHSRSQAEGRARMEAMWRLFSETKLSVVGIGHRLQREHTTVLHGLANYAHAHGITQLPPHRKITLRRHVTTRPPEPAPMSGEQP